MDLIERGLTSAEDIDKAVRYGFGFRYLAWGPIMQKECTGLDTQLAAAGAIYRSLNNAPKPSKILSDMTSRGETGADAGKGIWDWTPEKVAAERAIYAKTLDAAAAILTESDASRKQYTS